MKQADQPPSSAWLLLFQEIGLRLDRKGYLASNDGNLSARDHDGTVLVTATGSRKGYLRPEELLRIGPSGRVLAGTGRPSSETSMHLTIYAHRPDVMAIVHAHPPVATGFAVARRALDEPVLPEVIATLGTVPLAEYATPGTGEIGASLLPFLPNHDAILLANHGVVAFGPDLEEAYFRLERVEQAARILLAARLLGRISTLEQEDVLRLRTSVPASGEESPKPYRSDSSVEQDASDSGNIS